MHKIFTMGLILVLAGLARSDIYTERVFNFDRKKSQVSIREISHPTQANLDYAAYNNNPIRFNPEKFKPKAPRGKISLDTLTFAGVLDSCVLSFKKLPLTAEEKNLPMAWLAVKNLIWEQTQTEEIANLIAKINGYKWADPSIYPPYQEVVTAWIHNARRGPELWVKIELAPWVKFLKQAQDEEKDGFKEFYGRLKLSHLPEEKIKPVFKWMQEKYLKVELNKTQVLDWAQLLASYWYPSLNTDIVPLPAGSVWPNQDTEKKILKSLGKLKVENPTVVIRGNPLGKPIYNIFHVPHFKFQKPDQGAAAQPVDKAPLPENTKTRPEVSEAPNFIKNNRRFAEEMQRHSSYGKWELALKPSLEGQKKILSITPDTQLGLEGKNGWLFFRRSLLYTQAPNLESQPEEYNPLPQLLELKNYLKSKHIDFLFVPIPPKSEVYPEYVSDSPVPPDGIINPWGRKFLAALQDSGLEVFDLLPQFLEAKKQDEGSGETLYQKQDTHWTTRGLQLAAKALAAKVKEYPWYSNLQPDTNLFSTRDTLIQRRGDIVERLPESLQTKYTPPKLKSVRVFKNKKPLQPAKESPIILMGDSFTGVFEHIDGKNGGVGSHLALLTGLDMDIITSWGGGPLVRSRMLKARYNHMGQKKLVIYMMAARDLYQYSQKWESIDYPE